MDEFEKAAWDVDKNINSNQENVIEWLRNSKTATVTFSQPKYVNKVKELAKKFPEEVQILHEYDDHLVAHVATRAIKLNLVTPREYSEEEKQKLREQLKRASKGKSNET